jgi:hypothetical protein
MFKKPRPDLLWTAAVALAVVALSLAAWKLWSRPSGPGTDSGSGLEGVHPGADTGAGAGATGEQAEAERAAAAAAADQAMEEGRFRAASEILNGAEDGFGWSEVLGEASARLALREADFREALRPVEFRIESIVVGPEDEAAELYARYRIEGTPVFASEPLALTTLEQSVDGGFAFERSHVAVLRTSFARGASLEIVEPGGIFDSEDVLLGPIQLSPLPETEGGRLDYPDADARVRSISVSYRTSPYEPGVHIDRRPSAPPADATAAHLVEAFRIALLQDDLEIAKRLEERLATEFPGDPSINYLAERIAARTESLQQNHTRATFTILEFTVDPRPDGDDGWALWASGGEAPSFRSTIRTTDGRVLAETDDAKTAPYLTPGGTEPPPEGNVLHVFARGAAPLTLVVKDSSPRFSSRIVGDIDLPVTLGALPRGTGTIVIERQPRVLIQPGSEPNRIRRVVLRWAVTR